MSLPALVVSEAVGYATSNDPNKTFNDLQTVGLWPAGLYIQKVSKITLFFGANVVNGIEIVYDIKNDSPKTIKHGQKSGTPKNYLLSADEYFVGFFGAVDDNADAPILRRLGFLIYNNQNGALSNFGPYPDGNQNGVKGFTSLGLIAGFSGTESTNGSLDTLAIYKFMSSGDSNTGISGGI